ncbi:hypothetical protein SLS62_009820 [Diatrype stigma]|uniref:Rieske domain-containing protein n=1 Tax=Diatrype stigma TaxID=117547 RepID=A0AAN9UCH0_9PEZI
MASTSTSSKRAGASWTFVGLASSFPNVDGDSDGDGADDASSLAEKRSCRGHSAAGCRVFRVPRAPATGPAGDDVEEIAPEDAGAAEHMRTMRDQVLVFQYKGKFHAVDNRCPHSSYPLSNGTPFDIEDFGVVLSSGLSCPKHGWSFDLHTGQADRGTYKLGVWELELRPVAGAGGGKGRGVGEEGEEQEQEGEEAKEQDKEVWVRRKQRLG